VVIPTRVNRLCQLLSGRCLIWQQQVHLLPELRTPELKEELMKSITQLNPFEISRPGEKAHGSVFVDSITAACLLPVWKESQSMGSLVERWQN